MKGSVLGLVALAIWPTQVSAEPRRPVGDEWDQVRPLFAVVESVAAGKTPADDAPRWQCHFLDAEAGVVFVPFTVQVADGTFDAFPVAMYLRVVLRGAPAPAPGPTDALAQYPFEDAAIFSAALDNRFTRAFTAPPGEYDVYVALRGSYLGVPKTVVVKQPVAVPDLKSGLALSSIILADKIEADPAPRRLDFEEQLDDPYAWWGAHLVPALRDTFRRGERLALTFAIYNAAAADDGKPDVVVEYTVHARSSSGETFFNQTKPELLNAATLPGEFHAGRGDLLVAGRQISLAPFPDGTYRLEVKVTDRISGTIVLRDVIFTVRGS